MNVTDFIMKLKIAVDRGRIWVGYIQFFMLLFITVTSMKQYHIFNFIFVTPYWYIYIGVGAIISILFIGYADVKIFKTFQKETEIYAKINPVQKRLFENQNKIINLLKKGEEKK